LTPARSGEKLGGMKIGIKTVAGLIVFACPFTAPQTQNANPANSSDLKDLITVAETVSAMEYIPPIPNAPFSANVSSTRIDSNGVAEGHRRIARDRTGRVFYEHRSLVSIPDIQNAGTGTGTSIRALDTDSPSDSYSVTQTLYTDPVRHVAYICTPLKRICYACPYGLVNKATQPPSPNVAVTVTALGQKKIDGLNVIGSRKVLVANNSQHIFDTTIESWYSPDLQINLMTKRSDGPFRGEETSHVQHLKRSQPNPKLFTLPANYKVVPLSSPQGNSVQHQPVPQMSH
jgi:hypothetical protein